MAQNQPITLQSAELLIARETPTALARFRPTARSIVKLLPSVKDSRRGRIHANQWKIVFLVVGIMIALTADPAALAIGLGIASLVFWLPLPALAKRSLLLKVQKMGSKQTSSWEPILLEIRKDILQAKHGKDLLFRAPLADFKKVDDGLHRAVNDVLIRHQDVIHTGTTTIRLNQDDLDRLKSCCAG